MLKYVRDIKAISSLCPCQKQCTTINQAIVHSNAQYYNRHHLAVKELGCEMEINWEVVGRQIYRLRGLDVTQPTLHENVFWGRRVVVVDELYFSVVTTDIWVTDNTTYLTDSEDNSKLCRIISHTSYNIRGISDDTGRKNMKPLSSNKVFIRTPL